MDRASRLKDLSDELRRLFEQNVTEQEAYEQVKDDDRFDAVRLAKVSTAYKQFRSEKGKKPKRKKTVDSQLTELLHRSGQLAYFQSTLECDHKKKRCLTFWNGKSFDGRFFVILDRMKISYNTESFILKDVFSNKACRADFSIIPATKTVDLHLLTNDTGLLVERMDYVDQQIFTRFSLSLLEFNWAEKEIRKVHTLIFEDQDRRYKDQKIIIDTIDTTRFLLCLWYGNNTIALKVGHVRNNEVLLEEDILPPNRNACYGFCSLSGNTLYNFKPQAFIRSNDARTYVTRLDHGAQTSQVILNSIPDQFSTVDGETRIVGCFAMDRLYLAVQIKKTKHYGIIWSSYETRIWKLIDFRIKKPITYIQFMPDGHFLWIQSIDKETAMISDVHQMQKTLYRILLKKPEKLYDLAWFSLVRSKSKLKGTDPYEESQEYLPFYSEIRCPFEE